MKILAKDKAATEKTLRFVPTEDLTKAPGEDRGLLLKSHFPDARINRGPERSLNTTKTDANSVDWHMVRMVVTEDRLRWAVNTFMPYKVPVSTRCLQKGLHLIIKYFIKIYRGSVGPSYRNKGEILEWFSYLNQARNLLGEILKPHKHLILLVKKP